MKDHVLLERNRRLKLNQHLKALSVMIPGLNKMDKASILEDCTKYIKEMEQRVKVLEEMASKEPMESGSDSSSTDESYDSLVEIQARVSDRNVLIRIHGENRKGFLVQALEEIEKCNLSVVNSSTVLFGTSILDITIVVKMGYNFNMTVKDLVSSLRSSLGQFMWKNARGEEE